ncbi:hypothetical protein [Burkholderia multivorans]|uniref:hypothetical protein n=1 Tax=Burkholderia multivorans TaxID=87883 RepID=UPI001C24C65B|nr:hypothetical protein [Burkholderia multivorans]MBU9211842.1 hypothetical protein [Burkholderia multivorans]
MKDWHKGLLLFASALATSFSIFPTTNYQAAYPKRTATSRMDAAWERTGRSMRTAVDGVKRKHGIVG